MTDFGDCNDIFGGFWIGNGGRETIRIETRPLGIAVSVEIIFVGRDSVFP